MSVCSPLFPPKYPGVSVCVCVCILHLITTCFSETTSPQNQPSGVSRKGSFWTEQFYQPRNNSDTGGVLYGMELGSVTLKRIGFFCFPIKHSTHTVQPGEKNVQVRKNRSPRLFASRHPGDTASTAKPPDPMPCALGSSDETLLNP